jgi:peptide deformylase
MRKARAKVIRESIERIGLTAKQISIQTIVMIIQFGKNAEIKEILI